MNTLRSSRTILLLAATSLAITSADAQQQRVHPSLGNIDPEKGTIEMWVTPRFDPHAPVEHTQTRDMLNITQDGNNYFRIVWRATWRDSWEHRAGPWVRSDIGGETAFVSMHLWPSTDDVLADIREGQRRHIAWCWDGSDIWIYVDGEPFSIPRPMRGRRLAITPNENLKIIIGSSQLPTVDVEEFRISSLPRHKEELGFYEDGPMREDVLTLLLDTQHVPSDR